MVLFLPLGRVANPAARRSAEPRRSAPGAGSGAAVTPGIEVPQLEAVWPKLLRASLGLVGLPNAHLLQLAWLQFQRKEEAFSANDLLRAVRG